MPAVSKKPAKKPTAPSKSRQVKYDKPTCEMLIGPKAVTHEVAKQMMGYRVLPPESTEPPMGTDVEGNKYVCDNNTRNRPFTDADARKYAQDFLNRNFKLNGEALIFGTTGEVLSGQHRNMGLIYAEQCWRLNKPLRGSGEVDWKAKWPDGPPILETVASYGIDEGPETIRTLDNVKTRSVSDMLYGMGLLTAKTPSQMKTLSRATDFAMRFLWHRVGADLDAYAPRRTNSEAEDFVRRHKRLCEAVAHVCDNDSQGKVSKIVPTGVASGLMYLMASCKTDPTGYRSAEHPGDDQLDFSAWDKAEEFWVLLVGGNPDFKAVKDALKALFGVNTQLNPTVAEKVGVLVNAWNLFVNGEKMTPGKLKLEYAQECFGEDGELESHVMVNPPVVGGIDQGEPEEEEEEPAAEQPPEPAKVTPKASIPVKAPKPTGPIETPERAADRQKRLEAVAAKMGKKLAPVEEPAEVEADSEMSDDEQPVE